MTSDDFAKTVAKNSFWHLDWDGTTANTNTGFVARKAFTDGAANVNDIISLNWCSSYEELEDKCSQKCNFSLTLNYKMNFNW